MKKLLKFLITLIILAAICFGVWHFFGDKIKGFYNDKIAPIFNGDSGIDASSSDIIIRTFVQNPNNDLYEETTSTIKVEKDKTYTYEAKAKEHYHINEELSLLTLSTAKDGDEIKVYYDLDLVEITYNSDKLNDGEKIKCQFKYGQSITIDDFPAYTYPGYVPSNVEFIVTEAKTIDVSWEVAKYTLVIYLPSGGIISDPNYKEVSPSVYEKEFTYFDTLVLPTPILGERLFLNYQDEEENVISTIKNVENDLSIEAVFEGLHIYFKTVYDELGNITGDVYPTITAEVGEKVNAPKVNPTKQKPGYTLTWYTSTDEPFVFDYMPDSNIELVGRWELSTGLNFFVEIGSTIDNLNELVAAYDYVYYTYNDTGITWDVSNSYVSDINELKQEFQSISNNFLSQYHGNGKIGASFSQTGDDIKITLKLSADSRSYEGTLHTAQNGYGHYKFGGTIEHVPYRSESFNDFYIEKLTNTYECSTTNQLLFVAEHGYKPICEAGSKALTVYNKAKQILRQIVSDEMNDIEKAEAIYDYLVETVQYDHNALLIDDPDDSLWPYYDSYFMEGALLSGKSVCDGIAKSYSLLCNMEGIPCIEVTGNNHAWCKVKVNNIWYVVDATHGNTQLPPDNSIMTHTQFLISDATKTSREYTTTDYKNIKCNLDYDYFNNKELELGSKTIKYVVKSVQDLVDIIEYCGQNYASLTDVSVEFYYDMDTEFSTIYSQARALCSIPISGSYSTTNDDPHSVINLIFK